MTKQIDPTDLMTLAGGGAEAVVAGFNAITGSWDFDLWGDFWNAIYAAHGEGLTGAGNKIAILDTCPDLSIPQLAKGTVLHNLDNDAPSAHGTAVGLLIRYIAPEAELHFYAVSTDGKARRSLVGKAFEMIEDDPVDYICMSLGDVQPMDFEDKGWPSEFVGRKDMIGFAHEIMARNPITPTVGTCFMRPCTCALVDQQMGKGAIVLTAAGNTDGKMFCPARTSGSISVGFQRFSVDYIDGRTTKEWLAPEGPQSKYVDFSLFQPEGVVGSSFATPLLAGALALRKGGLPIRQLLAAKEIMVAANTTVDWMGRVKAQDLVLYSQLHEQFMAILYLAFDQTPHINNSKPTPTELLEMRLFLASFAVDKGLDLLDHGMADQAEAMFAWVCSFAPWIADAHGNLGNVHLRRAAHYIQKAERLDFAASELGLAKECYTTAIDQQPGNPAFQDGLGHIEMLAAQLGGLRH